MTRFAKPAFHSAEGFRSRLRCGFIALVALAAMAAVFVPCAAQSPSPQTRANIEAAARLVTEGSAALQQNDVSAAQRLFQRALQINPKDVLAHTYLGVLADQAGDLQGAESHFAAVTAIAPTLASARNNYGGILLKRGRVKQAEAQFEASLRLDANQPNALVNLAQIRFSTGGPDNLRSARTMFERAYAVAPDLEIARALVVSSLRLKDHAVAGKYFLEYSNRLIGITGGLAASASRAELGTALVEAGLFKEATTELNAALSLEPTNPDITLRLAKAYIALNELPAAGRALESALARGVETAPLYALLASVYEKNGHVENAIPAMQLAIQRDPQSETYRFTYGMLLTSVAPEAAVIRLKEALATFPGSARLWLGLGVAYFKAGKNDDAANALTHAIDLDPKSVAAYAYLGMTFVEIGQYQQAIKQYEQALAARGELGVVNYLLADVLLRQTGADQARIEIQLERAVKLEPSFAPARLALGKLYFRANRLEEARSQLEQVVKLDPNLAEAYYQLGRTYTKLKRTAEAQTTLATFKQLSETQKAQGQKDRRDIVNRLANVLF